MCDAHHSCFDFRLLFVRGLLEKGVRIALKHIWSETFSFTATKYRFKLKA